MSSKRLGGKGVTIPDRKQLTQVHIHKLDSMVEAVALYKERFVIQAKRDKPSDREALRKYRLVIQSAMVKGDDKLDSIMEESERLIEQAVIEDGRLTKKSGWVRSEEGIESCPALIASGDDRPYFDLRKLKLADAATVEPIKIVISTDSKEITNSHASAFIAAARLAQQFRPLEIWWQSAWLKEDDADNNEGGYGHVILVPLIQGDMDFSRVQFVLSNECRDHAGYSLMFTQAWKSGYGWGGVPGQYSYLDGTFDFVSEAGIRPEPNYIAQLAARWAGLDSIYSEYVSPYSAEQSWAPPGEAAPQWNESAKDKAAREKRWKDRDKEREKEKAATAKERIAQ